MLDETKAAPGFSLLCVCVAVCVNKREWHTATSISCVKPETFIFTAHLKTRYCMSCLWGRCGKSDEPAEKEEWHVITGILSWKCCLKSNHQLQMSEGGRHTMLNMMVATEIKRYRRESTHNKGKHHSATVSFKGSYKTKD